MDTNKSSWNKSTQVLALVVVAALAFMIGGSMNGDESAIAPAPVADTTVVDTTVDGGGAPIYRYFDPAAVEVVLDDYGQAEPLAVGENWSVGRGDFKTETITVDLELDGNIEYKAVMKQGDSLVYSWTTDGGMVYTDFHAHDEAGGPDFFTRYSESESNAQSGSILAAYDGQHGWFWLNLGDDPATITLEVAGFYEEIIEIEIN